MATNTSFVPTARDLIMVFPRLAQRAGSLAWYLPEHVDLMFNKIRNGGGWTIADATAANTSGPSMTTSAASVFLQNTAAAQNATQPLPSGFFSWFANSASFEGFRGWNGMFAYFSSRWALATFAVSILLNRTHFYASSRQNLALRWKTRLLVYSIPIALLLTQMLWVLQAMKCQTSPDFALYRYGDPDKNLAINFGGEGGLLYYLSAGLLFWQNDSTSCAAMSMSLNEGDNMSVLGSFAFIWPFFLTICICQFIETLACALQGRQPMPETGMTTFEHSLAFAECEAMIANALGLGVFGTSKSESPSDGSGSKADGLLLLTRPMILQRLNVPSEVLLICFISCLSHLSSAALAVIGKRQKHRLINTSIWALCHLGAFVWSFIRILNKPLGTENDLGILRFPTVCIIGFVPHILILSGITVCGFIYGLALLITAVDLPPDTARDLTLKQRLRVAINNLQANVQFSSSSSVKLNWQEDFYTNLLKVGFNVLTAASEAVYLNEGNRVRVHDMTWLERKRLTELTASQRQRVARLVPSELRGLEISANLVIGDRSMGEARTGYARERRPKDKKQNKDRQLSGDSGMGMSDRRTRWEHVVDLLNGIARLILRIEARIIISTLAKIGVQKRPAWLARWAAFSTDRSRSGRARTKQTQTRDFYVIGEDGTLTLPRDLNVDVEEETRRRLRTMSGRATDDAVDDDLYSWWKTGGWWGDVDGSGDYQPDTKDDEDLTSVISASDANSARSEEWESDGQLTPTEDDPSPGNVRDGSLDTEQIARLLDPKSPEEKEEARILSRHFRSQGIVTRSRYRTHLTHERSKLLTNSTAVTAEDEEAALEQFILDQRRKARKKTAGVQSWQAGADGMGAGGPQCVVCQSSPRSILVWPCGCLSICDDCRVGVAARNFSSCLCCRTNVASYSRLYVP